VVFLYKCKKNLDRIRLTCNRWSTITDRTRNEKRCVTYTCTYTYFATDRDSTTIDRINQRKNFVSKYSFNAGAEKKNSKGNCKFDAFEMNTPNERIYQINDSILLFKTPSRLLKNMIKKKKNKFFFFRMSNIFPWCGESGWRCAILFFFSINCYRFFFSHCDSKFSFFFSFDRILKKNLLFKTSEAQPYNDSETYLPPS
jgi:hypothetical protein